MTIEIDRDRLNQIQTLDGGSHRRFEDGCCAMEAVSYIAREPWSDCPKCACPVIGAFIRVWNDGLSDDDRTPIMRPLIPRLVGTRATPAIEHRRALMAADWLVRSYTPAWLRLAGLVSRAEALEQLPEITSLAHVPSIRGAIKAARDDAAAARDAAGDAAGDAAWDAARAAAGDAAWDAAWAAAGDAAWDAIGAAAGGAAWAAARDAAWDAAGDAAWDAIGAALAPAKSQLQQSALALVDRMISATEAAS